MQAYIIHVTIVGKKEEFDAYMKNEFLAIQDTEIQSWGIEGVVFSYNRKFLPEYSTYTDLLAKYPSFFIKLVWTCADGTAGILTGRKETGIANFKWRDLTSEEESLAFRNH
jgi:hypothetical protein